MYFPNMHILKELWERNSGSFQKKKNKDNLKRSNQLNLKELSEDGGWPII